MKRIFTICFFSLIGLTLAAQCEDRYSTALFDDIEVFEDVVYGSSIELDGDVKELVFDFYAPANDPLEERPLIVWAHGGTFVSGDEDDLGPICEYFASLGYANATINYRLAEIVFDNLILFDNDITPFMADELIKATQDMRAAIRYFRKDAAENNNQYGIDTDQIFVGGVSAGAITAVHVAYMDDLEGGENITVDLAALIDANGGLEGESGNEGYSSEVSGVINFSGALADVNLMQADEVPIVSVHDEGDTVVPFANDTVVVFNLPVIEMQGSQTIHDKAAELGLTHDMLSYDQAAHVGYFGPDQIEETYTHVREFMAEQVICISSGLETLPYEVSVFPTLVDEQLNLRLEGTNEVDVRILDLNGKELHKSQVVSSATLDCQDLRSGYYFLNIRDGEYQTTKKFIVK